MRKNVLERLADGYVFLLLGGFLLWPGMEGYARIVAAKYRLFLWLSGGYCALSVLLWLELVLIRKPVRDGEERAAEAFLLGYLLFALLACLFSPRSSTVWLGSARHNGFLTLALYVLSFCLLRRFARPAV